LPQIWNVNILILPLNNDSNVIHDVEPTSETPAFRVPIVLFTL